MISRSNITDSKIVDTPIEYNCRLNSHDGESFSDPVSLFHFIQCATVLLGMT